MLEGPWVSAATPRPTPAAVRGQEQTPICAESFDRWGYVEFGSGQDLRRADVRERPPGELVNLGTVPHSLPNSHKKMRLEPGGKRRLFIRNL